MCPKLEIVEQPADQLKKRAARYPSEHRETVNIVGRKHTQEHPSFPRVRDYNDPNEQLIMEARCVTVENPNRDAPFFQLYNPDGKASSQVPVDGATGIAEFSKLIVRRIKRNGTSAQMDHRRHGVHCTTYLASENKTSFRLRFQACTKKDSHAICDPVYSDPISTEEITSLKISKLHNNSAPMTGGTETILCCEKVRTRDIRVRFFREEPAGCWEAYAQDVRNHEKVTLWFTTPAYTGMWKDCNEPVVAHIQLCYPNDGRWGEPEFFTFLPKPEAQCTRKRPSSTQVGCLENKAIPTPSSTGSSSQIPSGMADPWVNNEAVTNPPPDTSSSSSPFINAGHIPPSIRNHHFQYNNPSTNSCASTLSTSNDTQLDFTSSPNQPDHWENKEVVMSLSANTSSSLSPFTNARNLSPSNYNDHRRYSNSSTYSCTSTSLTSNNTLVDFTSSPRQFSSDPWVNNEVQMIPSADISSSPSPFTNGGHLSPGYWNNHRRYSNSSAHSSASTSSITNYTLLDSPYSPSQLSSRNSPLEYNEVGVTPFEMSLSGLSFTNTGELSPGNWSGRLQNHNSSEYRSTAITPTSYGYEQATQTLNQPLSQLALEQAPQSRNEPNSGYNLPQLIIQDYLNFNLF